MKEAGTPILKISDMVIGYQGMALMPPLKGCIRKGELVSVIGHNGIGKSTFLRTVAGVTDRISGRIELDGIEINTVDLMEFARKVGYISTEIVNAPNMTVFDLIATGRYPYTNWFGAISENDRRIIHRSAEQTGVSALINRFISELSDGERQRSMIARVLAQETDLLIMDEPAAFLDIRNRHEIMSLLHHITRINGKTIIMSTHDLQSAMGESDVIWILTEEGINSGAPEDLVLSGALENIFSCDSVKFRKSDGGFYPVREARGEAYVSGSGMVAHWTMKALTRAGYSIIVKPGESRINVECAEEGNIWKVSAEGVEKSFNNLYDLSVYIRSLF